MKVLVTGAAGFIGNSLAAHFRKQGHTVFVDAERGFAGATTRWPLSESGLSQASQGQTPEVIFHAAGSGTVAKVAAQPALELPANLSALLAVLQFARAQPVPPRIVLLSSAALYGNAPATPQVEGDVRAPVSLYGLAKAQAEQLAEHYAREMGVMTAAVRLFSVYGPGLRKQLLWDAMAKFAAGQHQFHGTGAEQRDWVHIDDVCRFMACLVARPAQRPFDVFNCAGFPASTGEVLSALALAAGAREPTFNGIFRPGDPQALVADCSKAQAQLGWRAEVPWRHGVQAYAQWFGSLAQGFGVQR